MNFLRLFLHDMAYGDFRDLKRRTASDKVLKNRAFNIAQNPKYDGYQRAFNIAKNPKYDGYQRGLAPMVF